MRDFRTLKKIASGGMGTVYLGQLMSKELIKNNNEITECVVK
jgi:serine/threonine protein kinase